MATYLFPNLLQRSKICSLAQSQCKQQFKLLATQSPATDEEKERELERISKEVGIE